MANAPLSDRGRIERIILAKAITFNGEIITKAKIEIDHINYGINKLTKKLNTKRRSSFTVKDIEKFIKLLDGESIYADDYKGKTAMYSLKINCPIPGKFKDKVFLMIFDINYESKNEIHTVTLIPGW